MNGDFEIFWVTFQLPKFGTEGKEFDPQEWHMGVCTAGGRKDAEAACKQYHKGCKVVCTLSRLENSAGCETSVRLAIASSKSKTKKKGK